MIEETAALITADSFNGSIPSTNIPEAHALVYNEPLGVVLGIAPWNSPLILGMRAVLAPVATGNTAILKVSLHSSQDASLILTRSRDQN